MTARPLQLSIPGLIGFQPAAGSPEPGAAPGLVAAAGSAAWSGGRLRFDLLLAWTFPPEYAATFHRLTDAIVLVVEDAATGSAFAMRTIDPHKKFVGKPSPNWRGPPAPAAASPAPPAAADGGPDEPPDADDEPPDADDVPPPPPPPGSLNAGWLTIPVEVAAAPPAWSGPSVHATAVLHGHVSNTIGFTLSPRGVNVSSWKRAQPWTPATHVPGGPPPPAAPPAAPGAAPAPAGIALRPRAPGAGEAPHHALVEAHLRLAPGELAAGGAEAWLRSVFVLAIRRGDQAPVVASWLGDRLVLEGDLREGPAGGEAVLPLDVRTALGHPLPPGTWDVHVSARHRRSDPLEVTLP